MRAMYVRKLIVINDYGKSVETLLLTALPAFIIQFGNTT